MQKLTVPQLLIMHITDKLSLCESSAPRPPLKLLYSQLFMDIMILRVPIVRRNIILFRLINLLLLVL